MTSVEKGRCITILNMGETNDEDSVKSKLDSKVNLSEVV